MRRSTLLAWAFRLWTVGGPVLAQALNWGMAELLKSPIPCPICGAGSCGHRHLGQMLLHALGAAALWIAWARVRAHEGAPPPWLDSRWLATWIVAALGVTVAVEWFWDVESVVLTGPLLVLAATFLVHPGRPLLPRLVGWCAIAAPILGHDMVVLFQLRPSAARVPLGVLGLLALVGAAALLGLAWRRSRAVEAVES